MSGYYANITLSGPGQAEVAAWLKDAGEAAFVSPVVKGALVVFHQDLSAQEDLARRLSAAFHCPALLVMDYGGAILLYQLYVNGDAADAYVSTPHDDLDTGGEPVPEGDPAKICAVFGMEHKLATVDRILRRPTDPTRGYALAVNRHGELAKALGLPLFAAGAGYGSIELGELPEGPGFDPREMMQIGS